MTDANKIFRTFMDRDIPLDLLLAETSAELTLSLKQRKKRLRVITIASLILASSITAPMEVAVWYGFKLSHHGNPTLPMIFFGLVGTALVLGGQIQCKRFEGETRTIIPQYAARDAAKAINDWMATSLQDDDIGIRMRTQLVEHLADNAARPCLEALNAKKKLFSFIPAFTVH